MGSSGGGSFSDYSEQKSSHAKQSNGGSSKVDKCNVGFGTSLEDVARCSYFNTKGLPPSEHRH